MAYAGAATGAAGAIFSVVGGLLKKKVNPPNYTPTDPGTEAGKAIAANQKNLPAATQLASATNEANQNELLKRLREAIPNFDKIQSNVSQNIADQTAGQLPKDVVDLINRSAAAQNVAGGVSGSGFGRNLAPRDLGLTSLQLMQQGFSNANQWLATQRATTIAPQFDVSNMFITPAQQIQATFANNAGQWNVNWLQTQLKAAQSNRNIIGGGFEQFGQSLGSMGAIGGTGGG